LLDDVDQSHLPLSISVSSSTLIKDLQHTYIMVGL
jgi:hypothetical protein